MATSTNIISEIGKEIVTDWTDVESWFTTAVAKVNAVLPGASTIEAQAVSLAKQGASDVLSDVAAGVLSPAEQAFITGIDSLADATLTTATGGAAVGLIPLTNNYIQARVSQGYAALQAWALKASAGLAENNAALGGGTAAPGGAGAAGGGTTV